MNAWAAGVSERAKRKRQTPSWKCKAEKPKGGRGLNNVAFCTLRCIHAELTATTLDWGVNRHDVKLQVVIKNLNRQDFKLEVVKNI